LGARKLLMGKGAVSKWACSADLGDCASHFMANFLSHHVPACRVRLAAMSLRRPRQWGACWLGCELWRQLGLDTFWGERLHASRKGTRWDLILQTLVLYRLIDPGSEWRLQRHWFDHSAIADLLGSDFRLAEQHHLYACHARLLAHKRALFDHLTARWRDLFDANYEVLL
jgi:hypothetical protein